MSRFPMRKTEMRCELRLEGRVAIASGGSPGIGRGVATAFAGGKVPGSGRRAGSASPGEVPSAERVTPAEAVIEREGGEVRPVSCAVSDPVGVRPIVAPTSRAGPLIALTAW